jgi:carbonic anhydrase
MSTQFSSFGQTNDSTLNKLITGNTRFVNQTLLHPHDNKQALLHNATMQNPFAYVHACSDSRVSPELIFDQGIGDLFVSRVAGNVMGDGGLGSIEYAIENLGVRFILILGHTHCGAVKATVSGEKPTGHIIWLVKKIVPSFLKAKKLPGDVIENTIKENVKNSIHEVINDKGLSKLPFKNEIIIAGGIYHLEDGSVEIIVQPMTFAETTKSDKLVNTKD